MQESEHEHIASFVIQCEPRQVAVLTKKLHNPPRCEITHADPAGKLVAVFLTRRRRDVLAFSEDLLDGQSGVYSVNLVYHHSEPTIELDKPAAAPANQAQAEEVRVP